MSKNEILRTISIIYFMKIWAASWFPETGPSLIITVWNFIFQFNVIVNVDEIVIFRLLTYDDKDVKKPIILALTMVADIVIALMIQRKINLGSIDPTEYYCKPSILHILIIMANIIFSIGIFVPQVFFNSVSINAIFITIWYYCIDFYVFTYIYFNVPKRKYAIRYIYKLFLR